MRRLLILLPLFAFATNVTAGEFLGPVQYLKILAESKLQYKILGEPSKTPATEVDCPRRDASMRLKVEGDTKRLVDWTIKPEAMVLLEEGEKLYEAKDYAGAAEKYKAALAADSEAVNGYYYYGDTLLIGANDPAAALAQYEKGLALDPTMPSGHFFESTALMKLGRPDEAREQIIKALTYYPSYESVWKVINQVPERYNIRPVVRYEFNPPAGYLGVKTDKGIDIYGGPNGEWLGYAICKAVWANEKAFEKRHRSGWALDEERACVLDELMSRYNAAESSLKKEKKPVTKEATIAALDPLARHLWDASQEHLLDGYILFNIIGWHCPLVMSLTADPLMKEVDAYIRKYVIVAR